MGGEGSGNPNVKNYGFGARPKEEDDEYRSRIKGVPRNFTWTKDKCVEVLNDCLDILKRILKDEEKINKDNPSKAKQETIRDTITLINKILDYMKYLYPQTQTNVNVNIDVELEEIIKKWKERKLVSEVEVVEFIPIADINTSEGIKQRDEARDYLLKKAELEDGQTGI